MTKTVQQIQKYMHDLGWSLVDLHRVTFISLQNLDNIMKGIKPPTHIQLMIIVNKITKQYPSEQHWGIYQSIVIQPNMTEDLRK
jgi:hypothetical protein